MQQTVRIERYADQGRCVAHIDGRVVFVRFALPGELVRVELDEPTNRDDRFWTGEVVEVLEASDARVEPAWPLAGPLAMGGGAGGADLVHVGLDGQLAWKSATVSEQMRRLGHTAVDVPVERMDGDEALGGLHWRTRIEMIADDRGRPSMRRRGTHVRVPIEAMPLATRALGLVADRARVWDGGFEPGARIRIAVPEPRGVDASTGVLTDEEILAAVGDDYAILVDGELREGKERLTERVEIDGRVFDYLVQADGFWQMHRQAPSRLPRYVLDRVREALDGRDDPVIWDLYSGSGLFTLPLATLAGARARVLSVEGSRPAARNAKRNIEAAGLRGVDARCGDVARTLAHVPQNLARPDVVVLDPPRAGAKAKVCRMIARSGAPTVVYVACDPASLARDTATLADEGYRLDSIRAFDIYPMTHHVETVAVFRRDDASRAATKE